MYCVPSTFGSIIVQEVCFCNTQKNYCPWFQVACVLCTMNVSIKLLELLNTSKILHIADIISGIFLFVIILNKYAWRNRNAQFLELCWCIVIIDGKCGPVVDKLVKIFFRLSLITLQLDDWIIWWGKWSGCIFPPNVW